MLRSVGPTTSVNRKTVSNGTFMQIVLFLVTAAVVIWVNFWYGASCNTTFDERELEAEIDSLNRRILLAESTVGGTCFYTIYIFYSCQNRIRKTIFTWKSCCINLKEV